jgi:hypothetical protein
MSALQALDPPFTLDSPADNVLSNPASRHCKVANTLLPSPLESPPVLLELRNGRGGHRHPLQTSGMRTYESSKNIPPVAGIIWSECKKKVLEAFSDAGQSPLDLILDILDSMQHEYENYRSRWFSPASNKLSVLLDSIFAHPKGRDLILRWMHPHALEFVCSTVSSEMDCVVKALSLPGVEHITSEFIANWTLETVVEPAIQLCPSLLSILHAAAQTEEAKQKNKIKTPKTVGTSLQSLLFELTHIVGL